MNSSELLSELVAAGVRVEVEGNRLHVDAPKGLLTPELVKELRSHKSEILRGLLRSSVRDAISGGLRAVEFSLLNSQILEMSMEEFAHSKCAVEVYSAALDDTFLLASDNAATDPRRLQPTYRASELSGLTNFDCVALRHVHEVKKIYGGTVIPS